MMVDWEVKAREQKYVKAENNVKKEGKGVAEQ